MYQLLSAPERFLAIILIKFVELLFLLYLKLLTLTQRDTLLSGNVAASEIFRSLARVRLYSNITEPQQFNPGKKFD
jgi:hypothetical protein